MEQELKTPIDKDIDFTEYVYIPKCKPSEETIKQLRFIKKLRLENKKVFYPQECIEIKIAKVLEDKETDRAINLIKEMQEKKGILEFTRDFLNSILKDYSNLSERTRQRRITEVLEKANVREGFREYKCLIEDIDRSELIEDREVILYSFK